MLLGGATAHSYRALGPHSFLNGLFGPTLDTVALPDAGKAQLDGEVVPVSSGGYWGAAATELPATLRAKTQPLMDEVLAAVNPVMPLDRFSSKERVSDFALPAASEDSLELTNASSGNPLKEDIAASETAVPANSSLNLLELLNLQLDPSQNEMPDFTEGFDGSRQGAIREFIGTVGSSTGDSVREVFQEQVAGVGKGAVIELVDAANIQALDTLAQPVLAVDYYGQSSELINGLVDTAVQSIGSVALPRIGPAFNDTLNQLTPSFG